MRKLIGSWIAAIQFHSVYLASVLSFVVFAVVVWVSLTVGVG